MFAIGPRRLQLVVCPYNKSHAVMSHRLDNHLIKCRRLHEGVGFNECKFNHNHVFPEAEIEEHERVCEDRYQVERFMSTINNGLKLPLGMQKNWTAHGDENWDTDPPIQTYNPMIKCMKEDLAIPIMHGTPTQLKARRAAQSARVLAIRNEKISAKAAETLKTIVVQYKVCRFNTEHVFRTDMIDITKHEKDCPCRPIFDDDFNLLPDMMNETLNETMNISSLSLSPIHKKTVLRLMKIREQKFSEKSLDKTVNFELRGV